MNTDHEDDALREFESECQNTRKTWAAQNEETRNGAQNEHTGGRSGERSIRFIL